MKIRSSLVPSIFIAAFLFLACGRVTAAQDQSDQYQPEQQEQDQQDPPTRVAQLNYIQGSVSYQPSGQQDWVQADTNRPLTTGDNLWADQNSRGELHVGSTALRIGDQTGISFLNLTDRATQIQLAQGMLEIHVRHVSPDDAYEIDTPNLAFSIVRPGDYRLDTDPNGNSTTITVYSGEGTVSGGNQTYDVASGRRAIFTGTNQLSENVEGLPGPDAFDGWARSREMREEHAQSLRYVSPDVTGCEQLDDYGARPPATPPSERQPTRPAEQPRPETRPPAARPPGREPARPTEQPRPEARPRTATPPQERPAPKPQEKQPPPKEEKPKENKEKPHPQPQSPRGL